MKTSAAAIVFLGFLLVLSPTVADAVVFFEEQFAGPALDSSAWRTETLTSAARWCSDVGGGPWGPGHWVDEGIPCHGVSAYSPYGTALLSDGLLHLSSSNGQACPFLTSRFPSSVPVFPASGDFSLKVRARFDNITLWGVGIVVVQTESTEPVGDNRAATPDNVVLQLWCDNPQGSMAVWTSLDGYIHQVGSIPNPTGIHEVALDCEGNSYTIRADGALLYGPVTSALRPTAIFFGNPSLAWWYPTDWTSFSVDYLRVELPLPIAVAHPTWGAIKAIYGD